MTDDENRHGPPGRTRPSVLANRLLIAGVLSAIMLLNVAVRAEPSSLEQAKKRYDAGLTAIEKRTSEALKTVDDQCAKAINGLARKYQKDGSLAGVVAANEFLASVTKSQGKDAVLPEKAPTELVRLREKYLAKIEEIELGSARQMVDFARGYLAFLGNIVDKMTKAGEIGVASAAQTEIHRIPRSKPILDARKTIGRTLVQKPAEEDDGEELPTGLVLYYSFDEDEGSRVTDLSGKGNHGRVNSHGYSAKHTAAGKRGGAYHLAGEDGKIFCHNSGGLDMDRNLTIAAWVRPNGRGSGIGLVEGYQRYVLWVQQNGEIRFADDLGHYVDTPAGLVRPGEWTHVTGVFRGKPGDRLTPANSLVYVNGLARSNRREGEWRPGDFHFVKIGGYGDMLIDEVMIFNRALSSAEIKALLKRPPIAEPTTTTIAETDPLGPILPAGIEPID